MKTWVKCSWLFLLSLFIGTVINAQVFIEGAVNHDGKSISDVTIQVVENNKVKRTLMANRRGQFEIDLPFDHLYVLTFRKAYMAPVSIDVDTRLNKDSKTEEIVVPLNMELVYRYQQIEHLLVKESIGLISQQGEGEFTFGFDPQEYVIERVKRYNRESSQLEKDGAEAIDQAPDPPKVTPNDRPKKLDVRLPESSDNENVESDDEAMEARIERSTSNNEMIATSKEIESSNLKKLNKTANESIQSTATNADDFIYNRKRSISKHKGQEDLSRDMQTDALIQKYDAIEAELAENARSQRTVSQGYRPIERTDDPGWFISEQSFIKHVDGAKDTYLKTTYHLLLMDITYYYKNSNEISEKEYKLAAGAAMH